MKIRTDGYIELYWSDLCIETQIELDKLLGGNGNYDVFPIVEIPIEDNPIE